jgi:nitroreductase
MTALQSALDTLIQMRRSVYPKEYTGEKIDDSIIMKMLEHADRAPTHKRTEPWRFQVFTGNGITTLAEFQAECYKKVTMQDSTFKQDRYENLKIKPFEASHIISVGMKRDISGSVPEWEELAAVFCAVENIFLTATAYGVGCYLSTGGVTGFPEAKEFFGLEQADRLCGFIYLGVVKDIAGPKSPRKPLSEKIKWNN